MRARFAFVFLSCLSGGAFLVSSGPSQAPQQQPPATEQPAPTPPQVPTPPPARPALRVVVLDPAHGGADAGARGATGVVESEVALTLARVVREGLQRQGLRVIETRQGNENPSFDDRSAAVNGQRGAVFISLHVSSTGPPGSARAYSFALPARQPAKPEPARSPAGWLLWDRAQEPYVEMSRRLAQLAQVQLAQKFRGSSEVPVSAAVRQLRTIAAPAIAIEVSSVSVPNRSRLEQMAPALAEAVSRAVAAFGLIYEERTQ